MIRVGIVDDEIAECPVLEARGMRQDVAQRYRFVEGLGDLEVLEIGVDVGIEVELALLDELHDRNPGKELGHGARPEQRLGHVDRNLFRDILVAVTLREDEFAVAGDGDRARRAVVVLHQRPDDAVDEGLELRLVVEVRRLRTGSGSECEPENDGTEVPCEPVHAVPSVRIHR